jgi:hypothetical protein
MFRRRRLLLLLAANLSRSEHSRAKALLPFLLVMCWLSFLLSLCLIRTGAGSDVACLAVDAVGGLAVPPAAATTPRVANRLCAPQKLFPSSVSAVLSFPCSPALRVWLLP